MNKKVNLYKFTLEEPDKVIYLYSTLGIEEEKKLRTAFRNQDNGGICWEDFTETYTKGNINLVDNNTKISEEDKRTIPYNSDELSALEYDYDYYIGEYLEDSNIQFVDL